MAKAPKSIYRLRQGYDEFIGKLIGIRDTMFYMRIIFTILILGWIIMILRCMFKTYDNEEIKRKKIERCFYAHRTLFGDDSVVMLLFRIWYISIVLLILFPGASELLVLLKTRSV